MRDSKPKKEEKKEIKCQEKQRDMNRGNNGRTDMAGLHMKINKLYNITDEEMALGLRYLKFLVNKRFRRLIKRYHPDSANVIKSSLGKKRRIQGHTFNELRKTRDYINSLKIMPATMTNVETVLRVGKGYKSTDDVWLPWE